jgi:hypothetical protein
MVNTFIIAVNDFLSANVLNLDRETKKRVNRIAFEVIIIKKHKIYR